MDATRRLPPELVEHARAFARGDRIPVTPRDAATVVLLRPNATGMQAYLLRRHRGMPFAGGMVAFPGGGVDPRDSDGVTTWETLQSNASGDTVSWRGDWQGDIMKGVLSYKPASGPARDFSFYSLEWSYAGEEARGRSAGGA